jgi:N-methylhydantoinase B/oxoprolinase/acetone carboxylase alpha subunit
MLSPIDIEVIRNALSAAAAEMDVTVWRTSRSTIVRELLDYSTAVFDADGWTDMDVTKDIAPSFLKFDRNGT